MIEEKLIRAKVDLVIWQEMKIQHERRLKELLKTYALTCLNTPGALPLFSSDQKRRAALSKASSLKQENVREKDALDKANDKIQLLTKTIEHYEQTLEQALKVEEFPRKEIEARLFRRRQPGLER